jgi:hypothetical protein
VSVGERINRWDFWVYPTAVPKSEIQVFTSVTSQLTKILEQGGSAILSLGPDGVAPEKGGNIALGFSSIFWNTAWTRGQAPHTLGILCNPKHPALKDFPTEYFSTFQWWDLVSQAKPLLLDDLSQAPQPIVRIIDDWFTNRSLALIFEARVGKGKLIISGSDLTRKLDQRPAARQMLVSLSRYASSKDFDPKNTMTAEELRGFQK